MAEIDPTTPNPIEPELETPVNDDVILIEGTVVDEPAVEVFEAPEAVTPPPPVVAVPVMAETVASEPPVEAIYAATPPQQIVYVQAPVPPRVASNRGIGTLIAFAGAIVFAILLAAAAWIIGYATTGATDVGFLATWDFYVPIAVYALAAILLVLIVNRGSWGVHVFGSLFVGAAVYFGTIGIDILVNWLVWQVQSDFVAFLASPFHIVAAVLAREVAVWFGWFVARRGRKVAERNALARADFDLRLAEFQAGNY
jgi:hypothetical protein